MKDFKQLLEAIENGEKFTTLLKYTANVLSTIALYVTIALALALIVYAVAIRNRDEQRLAAARRTMLGIVVGYSVGIITMLGSLRFLRDYIKGDITWHIWLVALMFVLVVVGAVTTLLLQKAGKKCYKWVALAFAVAVVALAIVLLAVVKPSQEDWGDDYIYVYNAQKPGLMYIISAVLVVAIAVLAFVGEKGSDGAKSITYAAICIAASFALSYVKFFSMPQGGSVTFASMLPLALYSYMFGTRKGVVAGVVYGLLQFVQSPQAYHMMQILLDYPIAFGAIGLAGIGRKMKFLHGNVRLEFAVGTTIAVLLRYVSHVLSGYFVFFVWAGDSHPLVYSIVYNSYVLVDLAIVVAMSLLALSSRSLCRIVLAADSLSN